MCAEGPSEINGIGDHRILSSAVCDAYLRRSDIVPGYVVAVWRSRHVAEITELTDAEAAEFDRSIRTVSRTLERHYRPAKLNFLNLGNAIPHLHVHIVPRYLSDANPGKPPRFMMIDPHQRSSGRFPRSRISPTSRLSVGSSTSASGTTMTKPPSPTPRYDGFADWYDANIGRYADAAGRELLDLLGPGSGSCLDLACGTGVNLRRLTDAGWAVTGVDLSTDQLRLARRRAPEGVQLIQADATHLPFEDASFDAVACSVLHTDVEDFASVCREAARVLRPGGRLAYVGIHPCYAGPFARNPPGEPPELHPGYRNTAWTTEGFSDGIRRRAGARHVPLAELLNAFLTADLRLLRIAEADDEDFPTRIGIVAER